VKLVVAACLAAAACGSPAPPVVAPQGTTQDGGAQATGVASDASVASDAAASTASAAPAGEHWVAAADADKVKQTPALPASEAPVVVIDARVMLDELRTARVHAPRAGTVHEVVASPGQAVKKGAALLVVDTASGPVTLKAPIAGQVVLVGTAQSSKVDETRDLVVVSDLDRVIVAADNMPLGIAGGAHASFAIPSPANRSYELVLAGISPDVPHLRGALQNADHTLQPGDTGTLSIVKRDAPGFVVPRTALLPGGHAVLVRRGNAPDGRARFVETPVTVGFDAGGPVLAVEGLGKTDSVVVDAGAVP
jgi:biotin carboxyl carrier protein